nr:hypothetical protein [Dorea sp. AM58-8]
MDKSGCKKIIAHLLGTKEDGSDVIGVYPLLPNGTCRFIVFDFDNHEKGAEVTDFAKKAAVVTKDAEREMLKKRIEEMRQFLQTQSSRVTEYDEQMVRRLIEKITVFDDKLIFEFKSGMTLELKR